MDKIGIAIIGAGEIAQNLHLPIYNKHKNVEVIAVCDKVKTRARLVAEKYGIEYSYSKVEDIIRNDDIKAVSICTSTDAHTEVAIQCLEGGKHVLIEKPVARTMKEAEQINKASVKSGMKAMVAMNQRFRQDSLIAKNLVENKEIGNVFYMRAGWLQQKRESIWLDRKDRSGGGVLLDLGVHLVDLVLWMKNFSKVKTVKCNSFSNMTKSVEDVVLGTLNFEDGTVAAITTSWSLYSVFKSFHFDLFGKGGRVSLNPFQILKRVDKFAKPSPIQSSTERVRILKKSFESEINHFITSISGGHLHSGINEAVEVMRIIEAMYISSAEGREVVLKY